MLFMPEHCIYANAIIMKIDKTDRVNCTDITFMLGGNHILH